MTREKYRVKVLDFIDEKDLEKVLQKYLNDIVTNNYNLKEIKFGFPDIKSVTVVTETSAGVMK